MWQLTSNEAVAGSSSQQLAAASDEHGPFSPRTGCGREPQRRLDCKSILIVEDEAIVALDLELAFEDEGARIVGPALSLKAALALLDSDAAIDGAVLDVDLGGRDVFPVAEILRDRHIPFVFHTGHASRAMLEDRFPGTIACNKPTLPSVLITALLRVKH
jgi:CheY-like chemotaxis protein